ncbi:hypothetical protein ACJ41O_007021 [Fusarium nematophilum]
MRFYNVVIPILGSAASLIQTSAASPSEQPDEGELRVTEQPKYHPDFEKAGQIIEAFRHSWAGYYRYAFPRDTLHPLSETWENDYYGWGGTAIGALPTAILMGETAVVTRILWYIQGVNFVMTKKPTAEVNVREATSRYMAYDLLSDPFRHLVTAKSQLTALLSQATNLADALSIAYESETAMPFANVQLSPKRKRTQLQKNTLTGTGSMLPEWSMLEERTAYHPFKERALRALKTIFQLPQSNEDVIPGLWPDTINAHTGGFLGSEGGWTYNSNGFYDSLLKMYNLNPVDYSGSGQRWVEAAEATMKYLVSHPQDHPELTFIAGFSHGRPLPKGDICPCAAGGQFIYGGAMFKDQRYIDFGLNVTKSCWRMAKSMPSSLPPLHFRWLDSELTPKTTRNQLPPIKFAKFAEKTGIWPLNAEYRLTGELFENMYYAYRMTGDKKWQDRAWGMFVHVNATCRVAEGFASLRDVTVGRGQDVNGYKVPKRDIRINRMEMDWMAKALKYLYLMFAPEGSWQMPFDADGRQACYPFVKLSL